MNEVCDYCVKHDVCCYKEKRKELNEEFYPFQMRCSLFEKRKIDIKTAPLLKEIEPNKNWFRKSFR